MIKVYMLLIEYHDGSVHVADAKDGKHVVAQEGNQYLLEEMGQRLLDENLISGYQMVTPVGLPVRKL